jgi:hypothetical protein
LKSYIYHKTSIFFVATVCFLMTYDSQAQTVFVTLQNLQILENPSTTKTYRVTDVDKKGNWRYNPNDNESTTNIGTVIASKTTTGCFKRVFDIKKGVNIDWFIDSSAATINEALLAAMAVSERINFGQKHYVIAPITIRSQSLLNPKKLVLWFNNSTLQAQNNLKRVRVIDIDEIQNLTIGGTLTLNGNAAGLAIANPMTEGGEAFLHITAPTNTPLSRLQMGSVTIINMPMCGVNIFTKNAEQDLGYGRITARALREVNGFNHLNIRREDFAVWGVNVRGAHRAVVIDTLYTRQDKEPWGDSPIEKPFYVFTFENQIDPLVHRRKDSLYIKNIRAEFPCSIVFFTQAVNHILVDNYLITNALKKPNTPDTEAYPILLQKKVSWIGSKHSWTSYRSKKSSFRIRKLTVQGTNPAFMSQNCSNDITALWLNKGIKGAVFDSIETDVRLKFHGDDYYFGYTDVPAGFHRIGSFVSHIPAKANYVQPLNADIHLEKLHLGQGSGVTFAMGNCSITSITQEAGTKGIFESRENKYHKNTIHANGFSVQSCQATDILWKFNWFITNQNTADSCVMGERYEFKNFSGNNYVQTYTNIANADGSWVYITAQRYDAEAMLRGAIQRFLRFVYLDWQNVTMHLADHSANDLTHRYLPHTNNNAARLSAPNIYWPQRSFINCTIGQ